MCKIFDRYIAERNDRIPNKSIGDRIDAVEAKSAGKCSTGTTRFGLGGGQTTRSSHDAVAIDRFDIDRIGSHHNISDRRLSTIFDVVDRNGRSDRDACFGLFLLGLFGRLFLIE